VTSVAPPPRPAAERWESPWDPSVDDRLCARGWQRVRLLHQMRRSLPLPDELRDTTRSVAVSGFTTADTDGLLAVNNRAFSWHPDQGGWDRDRLTDRMAEPWFDPADLLIHHAEQASESLAQGDVDGFCWTKVHDTIDDDSTHAASGDGPRRAAGEIFVIGTDPDMHGTGLGRALTVAGLDHLGAKGLSLALLYVESDNAAAITLYERLGMAIHHSDAGYARVSTVDTPS